MVWLTSQPWWVLLVLCIAVVFSVSFVARELLQWFLGEAAPKALANSATFMAAFSALFALLSTFAISTEWAAQSNADADVAAEAAAAYRLAWAATAPGVDTAAVQDDVRAYVEEVRAREWPAMARGERLTHGSSDAYVTLEREVRAAAASSAVAGSTSSELLGALDALAEARRDRLTLADRSLPVPVFVAIAVAGLALTVNTVLQTIPNTRRADVVFVGVGLVVSVVVSVVLVLNGPFRGTLVTSPQVIVDAGDQITSGRVR